MKISQSTAEGILSGKITNWKEVKPESKGNITILYFSQPKEIRDEKNIIIETFFIN